MAFTIGKLVSSGRPARLAKNNFIRFLSYATDDTKAEVLAPGYFNRARADLSVGTLIKAEVDCDGTQETVFISVSAMPLNGDITTVAQGGGGITPPYPAPTGYRWGYVTENSQPVTENGQAVIELERIAA